MASATHKRLISKAFFVRATLRNQQNADNSAMLLQPISRACSMALRAGYDARISVGSRVGGRVDQTQVKLHPSSKSRCKSIANEGGAKDLALRGKRGLRMSTLEKKLDQSAEPPNS